VDLKQKPPPLTKPAGHPGLIHARSPNMSPAPGTPASRQKCYSPAAISNSGIG